MKILVLNSGSSSVKYKLIDTDGEKVLAEGGVEKIGLADGFLKYKRADGSKDIVELGLTDHKGAIEAVLRQLTDKTEAASRATAKSTPWATAWCTEEKNSPRA